ncbi:MAG: hypothetical protein G01um101424_65 [Parcubacteria group bacterium Gr01-1014_24]|nr:MAG: hypothetical protein G01um101424_65 [Parcubacteria group bacterium Gr01-1014_24]
MLFSNDIFVRVIICVLGICGFIVAYHIYKHKKADKPLICPIGFDCTFVVHSDYSEFMHVPLEIFGMIYYALLSLFYLLSIFMFTVIPVMLSSFLLLASLGAFLFSMYLLCVQIFILKKGCSWCIVSTLISVFIFILTVFIFDFSSIYGYFLI